MSVEQAERGIVEAGHAAYRAKCLADKAFTDWGTAFRATRERRSLSLRAVAKTARVSPAFLSDVERGRRAPTTVMRHNLAKALGGHP